MPELPEVETVRSGLAAMMIGLSVKSVKVFDSPKSFPNSQDDVKQFLYGAKLTAVRRRAKVLIIDFDSQYSLVVHLKMTGQLVFRSAQRVTRDEAVNGFAGGHPNDSLIGKLPDRSTRVELIFTDGSKLYFNDQRKFGWVKLVPTDEVPNLPFMQKVGPEPLEDSFDSEQFIARIRRRSGTTIKAAILDQTVLAGVGNIYADESLWGAKIHPAQRVADISDKSLSELLREIKEVMTLSIEKGGSTDRNYVNAKGEKGSYLEFARVFRREGQDCQRCGQTIEKIRVAGRGTHICPSCQVL